MTYFISFYFIIAGIREISTLSTHVCVFNANSVRENIVPSNCTSLNLFSKIFILADGMSIQYISKGLGHADINTTYRVYSHLIEEYKDIEESALVTVLDKLNN
ncbi:hypothetical protein [Staphylococcus pettenkoferi]|uniref:Tyr recombinase domain-containing protein n=1 Tax=Staphylococcus pettenkoferi TaxID=170573 RepID=A0A9Q4D5Y7_9STAP|nr:hypothetical protein [Staphylococcus pettenkoferi]MCY1568503.1 hypothetical protein [Staphylococcus pettenkoferi]MCY1576620.1 hypothetical protein [Staphylococcus pettenkoferi]MCY1594245.1 hypothetical protein [Staphylococcus pettenkoferi]MCY1617195.1 hypothetical protein [Staphylococcus pettenkoferi]